MIASRYAVWTGRKNVFQACEFPLSPDYGLIRNVRDDASNQVVFFNTEEAGRTAEHTAQPSAATKQASQSAPVRSGGRRLRHRTSGASPRSQSSKQVFQRGEAGRRGAEDAERKDFGASRRVRSNTGRNAILCFSVASAPPFLLLCVEKPDCLPWIGSRDPLSACLDGPTQRCAHLARHRAGRDLGRSAGESVRYRHPGGNSSRVAVIRRISSAEDAEIAENARSWRFAQSV